GELARAQQELASALLDFTIAAAQLDGATQRRQRLLRIGRAARSGRLVEELARFVEKLRALATIRTRDLLPQRRVRRRRCHPRRECEGDERAAAAAQHRAPNIKLTTTSSLSVTSLRGKRQVDAASSTQWPRLLLVTVDRSTRARVRSQPVGSMN